MAVIGLITARGGSKTIPRKSIVELAGRPMLAYSCEAARESRTLDRVILSTDDEEMAEVGRSLGVEVPFMRPAALASDSALMPEVINHALDWLDAERIDVEAIVLLQPTSPLRNAVHIDESVELLRESGAETVVSLVEAPHQFNPISVMTLNDDGHAAPYQKTDRLVMRKQDKPTVYGRNGPAVLVLRPQVVRRGELYGTPTVGYVMDKISSVDIDDAEDLYLAELLLRERQTE